MCTAAVTAYLHPLKNADMERSKDNYFHAQLKRTIRSARKGKHCYASALTQ